MGLLVVLLSLVVSGTALACSRDDAVYLDSFLDTSCLQLPLTNTTLDAFGGLRLTTNGTPTTTSWESDTDFGTGVSYGGTTFGPVDASTLSIGGTGAGAVLRLPATPFPLTRDAGPVLSASVAPQLDSDNVDDPTVAKVSASLYVMWYSGTAEDGRGPSIFEATSSDGRAWTRANSGAPVLEGTPGAFDAHGVSGPHVIFDASDLVAPYKMWYSGAGAVFGAIGYATSADGVSWTKHDDPGTPATTDPVLDHGLPGSADSFAAADPSVMLDGATWKMWYTADDSNKKRIAFATSVDGIVWTKGGSVIAPEDPGSNANYQFGAFSPAVYKTAPDRYVMLLGGRKLTSGTFQTKLLSATSGDGIAWTAPSPALNPQSNRFDASDLNAPFVLQDGSGTAAFKLFYSGTALDANGNAHSRIGLATSANGSSFTRVDGSQTLSSALDISRLGATEPFDARTASGLSVTAPAGSTPAFVGFYAGNRGFDFKPRLGEATSADGSAWSKVSDSGEGGALFSLPRSGFDSGGALDPSGLYDQNSGGGADDWFVYFTAIDANGVRSIGRASTGETAGTLLPREPWGTFSQALTKNAGFDAGGVSHPSVIKNAASDFWMFFTGQDSNGVPTIGRATSTTAAGGFGGDAQVLPVGAAGAFDHDGVKDPVVVKEDATHYHMLYTGIEQTVEGDAIERIGYATSSNGTSWTKQGVVLSPSQTPYAADESGVEPAGMLIAGSTVHVYASGVDRTGRRRAVHLTSPFPLAAGQVPNGAATYRLGDSTTGVRDFRSIVRTSTGTGVTLLVSFLQPYSSAGNEFWSSFFPVTTDTPTETLNFLLSVKAVRWQARLDGPAGNPSLDRVDIVHAPVSFSATGSATTLDITPPAGQPIGAWGTLTASGSVFAPSGGGTASGTVTVFDPANPAVTLASAPLATNGDTTVALGSIAPAQHPTLRARFDLAGDSTATILVRALKLTYNAGARSPPPPPPPGPPGPPTRTLTLVASTPAVTFGQTATLTGQLTQRGSGFTNQSVSVLQQPFGATALSALGSASTGATGAFSFTVKPDKLTTYQVTFPRAPTPATVQIAVRPLVTLKVTRRGSQGTFTGRIAPAHAKLPVTIQLLKRGRWVAFARLTSSARSTFSVRKALRPRTKYRFRAVTAADADHLKGTSATALVERMRVSLAIRLRGRTAAFTGAVAPARPGEVVAIQRKSGGRFVKFATVKLSRRSTFTLAHALRRGSYVFRAKTADDKAYFGGQSVQRSVRVP